MPNTGYAFISAYLKGEEAKIVTSSHLDDILKASNIQDVLGAIGETDIGDYLAGASVNTFDELDEHLSPIKHYYIGDPEAVSKAIQKVADQGKAK